MASLLILQRNYLFAEKYSKKNPGKYAKLTTTLPGTDHHHSWRDPGALLDDVQGKLGGVQDSFSRGLSQLTGHENRRESPRPGQQNQTSIQLVRRFVIPRCAVYVLFLTPC